MKNEEIYHNQSLKEFQQRNFEVEQKEVNIIDLLEQSKINVLNGDADAHKMLIMIKELETKLKDVKEAIKEVGIDEIESGVKEWNGYKFEVSAGGRYDYSNNKEWVKLNNDLKAIEKDMQLAYKTKKTLINKETGEIIEPAIYKPNKQSIKITKTK